MKGDLRQASVDGEAEATTYSLTLLYNSTFFILDEISFDIPNVLAGYAISMRDFTVLPIQILTLTFCISVSAQWRPEADSFDHYSIPLP